MRGIGWKVSLSICLAVPLGLHAQPARQSKQTSATKPKPKPKAATAKPVEKRKFDASALNSVGGVATGESTKSEDRRPRKSSAAKERPRGLLDASAEDILATIKSINLLLTTEKNDRDRVKLLLNRAMASYSLARRRLVEGQSLKLDATGQRLLKNAFQDAASALRVPGVSRGLAARAHYIQGLVLVYSGNAGKARERFIESINTDPKATEVGWMALFVAEEFFDDAQYREAVPFYTNHQAVMDLTEKELANYKLAWTYLNLQNPARSQQLFIELIKAEPDAALLRDTMRDLAFVVTTYSKDTDVIALAESVFTSKQVAFRIEFLEYVLANLETQNSVALHAVVLQKLLTMQKDPVKKVQYLVAGLRTSRRGFASRDHFRAFEDLAEYLKTGAFKSASGSDAEAVKKAMDVEVQNLMRAYIETYSGRTKTPEKFSREQLSASLIGLFTFYEEYFPKTATFSTVLKLWLEVCVDDKNWSCVDAQADKIIAREDLKDVHERVALDQLIALENLNKDPQAKVRDRLMDRLSQFVSKFPKSPRWPEISARFGEYHMQDKSYSRAMRIFEDLFVRQATVVDLYRLQWARFEAQEYKLVVAEARPASGPPDPRIVDLKRESFLRLAVKAREADEFKNYLGFIRGFLSLGPAPDKALAARKDLYNYMLERKLYVELSKELSDLPDQVRFSKSLDEIVARTWLMNMRLGNFPDATRVVSPKGSKQKINAQLRSRQFLSLIASGEQPSGELFLETEATNRIYALGVLALTKPGLALRFLSLSAPQRTEELQNIAALALRMQSAKWVLPPTKDNAAMLGPKYPFGVEPSQDLLPVEKQITKIDIPTRPISNQQELGRRTQEIVSSTRTVRARLTKQIQGKIPVVQTRALRKAKDLELRTALFIENQPLPAGLTGAQIDEYQAGIAQVVQEFRGQAAAIDQLLAQVNENARAQAVEFHSRFLPLPDMTQWPWPAAYKAEELAGVRRLLEDHNHLGALLALDLLRPEPLASPLDYYWIRAGVLLSSADNEVLRRYVLDELVQANMGEIADYWRKVTLSTVQSAIEKSTSASDDSQRGGN